MKNKFVLCGCIGWGLEIMWTGICSLQKKERKMIANTSIWMFPIYGMAAVIAPVSKLLKGTNMLIRGGVYTACIFTGEFFTGSLLKKHDLCPWDYSSSKLNIKGIIRLDYAPLWFFVGLMYETILKNR